MAAKKPTLLGNQDGPKPDDAKQESQPMSAAQIDDDLGLDIQSAYLNALV